MVKKHRNSNKNLWPPFFISEISVLVVRVRGALVFRKKWCAEVVVLGVVIAIATVIPFFCTRIYFIEMCAALCITRAAHNKYPIQFYDQKLHIASLRVTDALRRTRPVVLNKFPIYRDTRTMARSRGHV